MEAELIVPDNHGGNINVTREGAKRSSWKDNPSNAQVIAAWLAGYGPNTRRTYSEGIRHWQQWCLRYKLDAGMRS
jgi:hypothetical protein